MSNKTNQGKAICVICEKPGDIPRGDFMGGKLICENCISAFEFCDDCGVIVKTHHIWLFNEDDQEYDEGSYCLDCFVKHSEVLDALKSKSL